MPAETSAISADRLPSPGDQRCRVAGVADRHDVEGRFGDRVHDGGRDLALEVAELAIEAVHHLCGVVVIEGVGTQCAAQPAHDDRRPEAVPLDIAHHETDLAAGQREDVVPVASQVSFGGQIPHRDVEALDGRGRGREQTALQGQGRQVRIVLGPLGQALADLRRCAFQAPGVIGREGSCGEPSHVQDPEQALRTEDGDPEESLHAEVSKDGVEDRDLVDLVEDDGFASRGDSSGESGPDGNVRSTAPAATKAGRRRRLEDGARLVQHQQGGGVRVHEGTNVLHEALDRRHVHRHGCCLLQQRGRAWGSLLHPRPDPCTGDRSRLILDSIAGPDVAGCRIGGLPFVVGVEAVIGTARN